MTHPCSWYELVERLVFWYWIAFEPGQRAGAESRGRMMRWNRRAVFLRPRNHAAARALARRRGGRMCNRAERCAPQPRGHAPQPREHRAINGLSAEKPIDFFMLRWRTKTMRWTQKCRRRGRGRRNSKIRVRFLHVCSRWRRSTCAVRRGSG